MNSINATKSDLKPSRKRKYPKPTPYVAWCAQRLRAYANNYLDYGPGSNGQSVLHLANRLSKGRLKLGDYNSIIKCLHEIDKIDQREQ